VEFRVPVRMLYVKCISSFLSRTSTVYFNVLCHYTYDPRWRGRRKKRATSWYMLRRCLSI